ncbi:MAG: response regulator [Gammaproteobacteria bacterium]
MSMAAPIPQTRASHQTTKERCRIFHIGLDARETLVIESVFRANPELACQYTFGSPTADDPADLMFVNGDDAEAIAQWQALKQEHPATVAIFATTSPDRHPGERTIAKPLAFRNFVSILDAITSTETTYFAPGAGDVDAIRVLVVDDSFPARQFMKLKLEELAGSSLKLAIELADSGEKAIQAVSENHFDLVFLDVVMPGMDGYEVCQQIKAIRPARVAMLTGRSSPVDFTRGRTAGCDNYLTKPPHDADLRTIMRLTSLKKLTARG